MKSNKEEAQQIQLGTMIRSRREELKMSQEDLCEGFCSVPNLSRIENNEQLPSRALIRKLAGRLGLPSRQLLALLDHEDLTVRSLQEDIRNAVNQCRRTPLEQRPQVCAQIREMLARLEAAADPKDQSIRQYILATEARVGQWEGLHDAEETLRMQLAAMRLTHPKFDLEEIRHGHYTVEETRLINQISKTYAEMGQRKKSLDILSQLLKYVENNNKALPNFPAHFCLIASNYAIDLLEEKRYDEAIEAADRGLQTSTARGSYQFLPSYLATQAACWYYLGKPEQSWPLYLRAYFLFDVYKDETNKEIVRQEVKQYLGIDISTLESLPTS